MLLEKSPQFVHRFRRSDFFWSRRTWFKKICDNLPNLRIKILDQTQSDFFVVTNNFVNAASLSLLDS